MPTIFTHPLVPLSARLGLGKGVISNRLLIVAVLVSIIPDLDVGLVRLGVPFTSDWGHRGFTHSLAFAALVGVFGTLLYRRLQTSRGVAFWVLFASTASHGLLDAFTNGGPGIELLWPFSSERFFFPWRPLEVSPIGAENFFKDGGLSVLYSEILWLVLPLSVLTGAAIFLKKSLRGRDKS